MQVRTAVLGAQLTPKTDAIQCTYLNSWLMVSYELNQPRQGGGLHDLQNRTFCSDFRGKSDRKELKSAILRYAKG